MTAAIDQSALNDLTGPLCAEGWITETGRFLPCDREWGHCLIAELIFPTPLSERQAMRAGWLRISTHGDRIAGELNQAQLNVFWDYCQHLRLDYEEELAGIERLDPKTA